MSSQVVPINRKLSHEQSNLLQQLISPNDVVLDLGSFASGTTKALLSRRCHCYVEDLPVFLKEIKVDDDFNFEDALKEHLVVANDEVKIDVILTWDLFHYLDLLEIGVLFKLLNDKIGPGTRIHSTRYTGSDIPERPQLFRLSDDLSYQMLEKKSQKKISNYSHTTIDLLTQLKYFSLNGTLHHTDQFSKGLVEYSLSFSENKQKLKPVRPVSVEKMPLVEMENFELIKLPNLSKFLLSCVNEKTDCIIDYGGSHLSNFKNLAGCCNFVLEEDLFASLAWQKKVTIGDSDTLEEQMLHYQDSVKFNLVLMWDLVNYCQELQFTKLLLKLQSRMEPGSLLHFVLPHSGCIASSPSTFKLDSQFQFEFRRAGSGTQTESVITTGRLVRLLSGYKVLAYYFGTHNDGQNYQEYLFEYVGAVR